MNHQSNFNSVKIMENSWYLFLPTKCKMLPQSLRQSLVQGSWRKRWSEREKDRSLHRSSREHVERKVRCGHSQGAHNTAHNVFFFFFNFVVRLYSIFDYWNVVKIFGSKTFPSVFPNAKNYYNDSFWTSDAASHSSRNLWISPSLYSFANQGGSYCKWANSLHSYPRSTKFLSQK